jgi:hypothetical protein
VKHKFTTYVTHATYKLTRETDESEDAACAKAIADFQLFMKYKQKCQVNNTCIEIVDFDIGDVL